MRRFWDAKARENAMYYISSYREYDRQDEEEFWKWGRALAERFLVESDIAFTGEENALEIGCGIGRMTACFAERFARVTAVDVSPEMIARARERLAHLHNVEFVQGSGEDLSSFDDGTFDFVFSYITLQHIPDPEISLNYVREAGRVLRTGGHAYLQVNNMRRTLRDRFGIRSRLSRLFGARREVESAGPRGLDDPAWVGSRLSRAQIERACHEGALEPIRWRGENTQYMWVTARKARLR